MKKRKSPASHGSGAVAKQVATAVPDRAARDETAREREALYSYEWIPSSLRGEPAFVRSAETTPALNRVTSELLSFAATLSFDVDPREFTPLCANYIAAAFLELGWNPVKGARFTMESLAARLGVVEGQKRQFVRLIEILEQEGFLHRIGIEWQIERPPEPPAMDSAWTAALGRAAGSLAELSLIRRCGSALPGMLAGKVDPIGLVFPLGEASADESAYKDSALLRNFNLLAHLAVQRLVTQLPRRRRVRILELGAGTGGTAAYVASALSDHDAEYLFTDTSVPFLTQAREKFARYPFMTFKPLDIGMDPLEQGLSARSFDIILASHVFHTTADLRTALGNVRRLLAPGGCLIFIEPVQSIPWMDMVYGLLERWWEYGDRDLRHNHPALPLAAWRRLLPELGFTDVTAFEPSERGKPFGTAFVLSRASDDAAAPRSEPAPPSSFTGGRWIVFDNTGHAGKLLANRITEAGATCVLANCGGAFARAGDNGFILRPDSREDVRELLDAVATQGGDAPIRGVVHMWSLDVPRPDSLKLSEIDGLLGSTCASVLCLAQELGALQTGETPRLWIVTRGAQHVDRTAGTVSPIQSALWGLGRAVSAGLPSIECTMVDLAAGAPATDISGEIASLFRELSAPDGENEVALRSDTRYVHRLFRTSLAGTVHPALAQRAKEKDEDGFMLEVRTPGRLDDLVVRRTARRAPDQDEVEIEVHAAGVVFNDVLKAMNQYPAEPDQAASTPMGMECAGIVSRTGRNVTAFQTGQRVLAVAGPCFGSHAIAPQALVAPIPGKLSFTEAAGIPVAFLAAWHALTHQARLKKGERILIHRAAGGVGLAAVQLAKRIGAEVFATAGTPDKREFLYAIGVDCVMDSRSLDFADEVKERTGGEGVDVVLNSLSGTAVSKGMSLLRDKGRFLELGKREPADGELACPGEKRQAALPMPVDIDELIREDPALAASHLKAICDGFAKGTFTPLPARAFPLAIAEDAFRRVASSEYVGETVLTIRDHLIAMEPKADIPVGFKPNSSYLITGGTGCFGLAVAGWMVERGARHLALMSRGGASTDSARAAIAAMMKNGAAVRVINGDVARESDLRKAMSDITQSMPPLRGVIHAAAVREDCPIDQLTPQDMRKVTDPRILGGWNLHTQTAALSLDFMIIFSSVSSIIGDPGRAGSAAANAFLDGLSLYRRARNLPSITVSWGSIGSESGRHGAVLNMPADRAFTLLARLIKLNPVHVAAAVLDWARFGNAGIRRGDSPVFAHLRPATAKTQLELRI